jgi:hypothetical protein
MSTPFDIAAYDDDPSFNDETELPTTPWSLDELERSADLGSRLLTTPSTSKRTLP